MKNKQQTIGKRIITMLLVLCMLFQIAPPFIVDAAGTDETVVELYTAEDLKKLNGNNATGNYKLMADIQLDNNWNPIVAYNGFSLDGNGHTITLAGKPFFDSLEQNQPVKNLMLKGNVTAESGNLGPLAKSSSATIRNCLVDVAVNYNPDSPYTYVGGVVGNVKASISNTVSLSTIDKGSCPIYGAIGNFDLFSTSGSITNCYFKNTDRIATVEGFSSNTAIEVNNEAKNVKNNTKIDKNTDLNAVVKSLNANLQDGDLQWEVNENGELSLKQVNSSELNTLGLEAVIKEAEGLNKKDYFAASWEVVEKALAVAEETLVKENLTQAEVNKAKNDLRTAIDALKKALPTKPVKLPEQGVIELTNANIKDNLNNKFEASETVGKYYILKENIELPSGWFSFDFAGVLDGNGHTITITDANALFYTISEAGVIQNVNFERKDGASGLVAGTLKGAILNCKSSISGNTSGFVNNLGNSDDGSEGIIVNCISVGTPKNGAFVSLKADGGNGNSGYKNGYLQNCYWPTRISNNVPEDAMIDCVAFSDRVMKTTQTRDLLNQNCGENGTKWGQGIDGYPYFGQDQEYIPEGSFKAVYPVEFKKVNDSSIIEIGEDNMLTLNPDEAINAGFISLKGVPSTSTVSWSCNDSNNSNTMAINLSTGEFFVYKAGDAVVTAYEHTKDGENKKVAEIIVTAVKKEIVEIHLFAGEKDVTNKTYTVEGSEVDRINVRVKYKGEEKLTPVKRGFIFTTDKVDTMILQQKDSGAFSFSQPGTATMTVTRDDLSATVDITSTYVPVTSIKPSVSGRNELHGKNSMYPDYNTLETQVIFEPENASYKLGYTVEPSDPEIAEFSYNLPLGYIPKKAGNVKFTASVTNKDPVTGEETVVKGETFAEFYYKNPLKEVTGPTETIKLTAFEEPQKLDLNFVGTAPIPNGYKLPYAVTETRLEWTFEGDGEVEITYPNKVMQIRGNEHPDGGEWVSNTEYFVRGIGEGTVTAIGTPVDDTAGAKPVRITFEVAPGKAPDPFDVMKFVADGIKTAIDSIYKNLTYKFSEEWKIYNLLRAGEVLPQDRLDAYYEDVVKTVKTWDETQKPTDIARVILPLELMDKDITNVGGVNLASMLYNHKSLSQGSNEVAWALIALDAKGREKPNTETSILRDKMVELLLSFQNEDGGFSLNAGGNSGADTSAMALQALAPYYKKSNPDQKVVDAVNNGIGYLKTIHNKGNHFDAGNSEANSQTIITLSVLGKDAAEELGFKSSLYSLMTALHDYFVPNEGFKHDKNMKVNDMASIQAMQALNAYLRFTNHQTDYWDLTDATINIPDSSAHRFISGENQKVQKTLIENDIELVVTGNIADITSVKVNDSELEAKNYTKDSTGDNSKITLKKAYLDTLDAGTYKIVITFNDGTATTRLFVDPEPFVPQKDINVEFTLYGDELHGENGVTHTYSSSRDSMPIWVTTRNVTIPERSTVLDVLDKILTERNLTYINKGNYISDINGLAEFSNGPNSGWMYLLNGVHSTNGVAEQELKDGDKIIFHYTDDYTLEDDSTVKNVVELIDAIGIVTEDSTDKINAARTAYDKLAPSQKSAVTNYNKLVEAEKTLANLKATEEDRKAAKKTEKLINAIGTVTLNSTEKIAAARQSYEALTDIQKLLVNNYDKLVSAEKKLEQLKGPTHEKIYKDTGDVLYNMANKYTPQVGSVGGEWIIIGLARSGRQVPQDYYDNVVSYVQQNINSKEQLHRAKSSDNSRVILALTAIGKDVTDVGGHNLLFGLTDMKYVERQGINGPIWALIAFDSHDYKIPMNSSAREQVTRAKLIAKILDAQLPDGGWDLSHKKGDADMTGMALQALAPYYSSDKNVKSAVDKALAFLSKAQNPDGTFGSIDGASSESSTQVIVALTALGINPHTDARFVKNGMSAIDGLCTFAVKGGFKHVTGGTLDQMATEQGYYALTSYYRMLDGKTSLYDMNDISVKHIHNYSWTIKKPATKDSVGEMVGRCSCGDIINKEIPVLGISGEILVEDAHGNDFCGKLQDKNIIGKITLTDDEQAALISGSDLKIILSVTDISKTISKADIEAIKYAAYRDTIGLYLDISMFKQIGTGPKNAIQSTNGMIKISFEVPESLLKEGRTYSIIKVHNGRTTVVECDFDDETNMVTFETDQFSTYALVYNDDTIANTSDETPIILMASMMLISEIGAVALFVNRKKKVR